MECTNFLGHVTIKEALRKLPGEGYEGKNRKTLEGVLMEGGIGGEGFKE